MGMGRKKKEKPILTFMIETAEKINPIRGNGIGNPANGI